MESEAGSSPDIQTREQVQDRIAALCAPLLEADGIELVDLEWSSGAGHTTGRLFIHRPGGVTIGECKRIHRVVMAVLEVEGIANERTAFEVGSPGLDRPLRTAADFRRAEGYFVTVRRRVPGEKLREERLVGKLLSVGSALTLELDKGGEAEIPLDDVLEGRFDIRM